MDYQTQQLIETMTAMMMMAMGVGMMRPIMLQTKGNRLQVILRGWRESAEKRLGDEGINALKELHSKYREMDIYQINQVSPKVKIPQLNAVLDDLNWISLAISDPKGPVMVSLREKIDELEEHIKKLEREGYYNDVEPERWRKLVEIYGPEKAKEVF